MPESVREVDAASELRALLQKVLVADPTEAANLLAGFLSRADLEGVSDGKLVALLSEIEPQIERTATALRHGLRQSPLPLSAKARAQLGALFNLYRASQALANLRLGLAGSDETDDPTAHLVAAHRQRVGWAARLILDCYQLYVEVPQPLFVDLHQFAHAARRDLSQADSAAWDAVRDTYVAVLLLGMVNPYALTVDEMGVLFSCLRSVADQVVFRAERPEGSARFVDMTGRLAPHIAVSGGKVAADGAVYVGVDGLYREETIQALDPECRVALRGFLRRLQFFLSSRESREREKHHVVGARSLITIGFYSVHHRLLDDMLYSVRSTQHLTFSGLDWEGLERPVHGQVKRGPSIYDFKLEMDAGSKSDVDWEALPDPVKRDRPSRLNEPATWDVVNLSERGLRLHWRLADNSRAAVDELILIEYDEEKGGLEGVVGLGIIRWVRHLDAANRTIDMGVERLPGDWMAYFAHPADQAPHTAASWPVLARVDDDNRIDRLIVPPDLPGQAQCLTVIREEGGDINIHLGRIVMIGSHLVVMETSSDRH